MKLENPVDTRRMDKNNDERTKARPMNKTELANLYGVCVRTLNKWLDPYSEEIGKVPGTKIFTTAQVETIFEKIGEP